MGIRENRSSEREPIPATTFAAVIIGNTRRETRARTAVRYRERKKVGYSHRMHRNSQWQQILVSLPTDAMDVFSIIQLDLMLSPIACRSLSSSWRLCQNYVLQWSSYWIVPYLCCCLSYWILFILIVLSLTIYLNLLASMGCFLYRIVACLESVCSSIVVFFSVIPKLLLLICKRGYTRLTTYLVVSILFARLERGVSVLCLS